MNKLQKFAFILSFASLGTLVYVTTDRIDRMETTLDHNFAVVASKFKKVNSRVDTIELIRYLDREIASDKAKLVRGRKK